ncbi:MAG: molybdopterin-binding protein, partial [Stappiaceae bacterium]
FTTGGIGPTHDDITADSVATAFQVGIDYDPRAVAILQGHYSDDQLTKARMRMARIPEGADLVENPISKAPGFRVENVFVMAGVPTIMQAMMDQIGPLLNTGLKVHSRTIDSGLPEGAVAETIEDIQNQNDGITIGSYPYFDGSGHVTKIVLRGRDEELLNAAAAQTENAITSLRARYSRSGT